MKSRRSLTFSWLVRAVIALSVVALPPPASAEGSDSVDLGTHALEYRIPEELLYGDVDSSRQNCRIDAYIKPSGGLRVGEFLSSVDGTYASASVRVLPLGDCDDRDAADLPELSIELTVRDTATVDLKSGHDGPRILIAEESIDDEELYEATFSGRALVRSARVTRTFDSERLGMVHASNQAEWTFEFRVSYPDGLNTCLEYSVTGTVVGGPVPPPTDLAGPSRC